MNFPFEMRLTKSETVWIPTTEGGVDFDTCSIQVESEAAAFNSGIITVKKSNDKSMAPVAAGSVTITADGHTQLTGSDWFKARWIVLDVTTDGSATLVRGVATLKKLGFSV